jgi:hypothetical protein
VGKNHRKEDRCERMGKDNEYEKEEEKENRKFSHTIRENIDSK